MDTTNLVNIKSIFPDLSQEIMPQEDTVMILMEDPENVDALIQYFALKDIKQITALTQIVQGHDVQAILGVPVYAELESFLMLSPEDRKSFVFTLNQAIVSDEFAVNDSMENPAAPAPEDEPGQLPDEPCGVLLPVLEPEPADDNDEMVFFPQVITQSSQIIELTVASLPSDPISLTAIQAVIDEWKDMLPPYLEIGLNGMEILPALPGAVSTTLSLQLTLHGTISASYKGSLNSAQITSLESAVNDYMANPDAPAPEDAQGQLPDEPCGVIDPDLIEITQYSEQDTNTPDGSDEHYAMLTTVPMFNDDDEFPSQAFENDVSREDSISFVQSRDNSPSISADLLALPPPPLPVEPPAPEEPPAIIDIGFTWTTSHTVLAATTTALVGAAIGIGIWGSIESDNADDKSPSGHTPQPAPGSTTPATTIMPVTSTIDGNAPAAMDAGVTGQSEQLPASEEGQNLVPLPDEIPTQAPVAMNELATPAADVDAPVATPADPVPMLPEDPCVADETTAIDATPSLPDEPCVAIVEVPAAITAPEAMLPEDPCTGDAPAIVNVIPTGLRAMPVATLMLEFALQDLPGHAQAGSLDAAGLLPRLQGLVGQWISERHAGPAIQLADIVMMPQGAGATTAFVSIDVHATAGAAAASSMTRGDVDDMLADLQHFCEAGNGESAFGLRLDLQGVDLIEGKIDSAMIPDTAPVSNMEVMPIAHDDTDNSGVSEQSKPSEQTTTVAWGQSKDAEGGTTNSNADTQEATDQQDGLIPALPMFNGDLNLQGGPLPGEQNPGEQVPAYPAHPGQVFPQEEGEIGENDFANPQQPGEVANEIEENDFVNDAEAEPGEVVQQPGEVVQQPGEVVQQPGEVAQQPGEVAQQPGEAAQQPGEAAQPPALNQNHEIQVDYPQALADPNNQSLIQRIVYGLNDPAIPAVVPNVPLTYVAAAAGGVAISGAIIGISVWAANNAGSSDNSSQEPAPVRTAPANEGDLLTYNAVISPAVMPDIAPFQPDQSQPQLPDEPCVIIEAPILMGVSMQENDPEVAQPEQGNTTIDPSDLAALPATPAPADPVPLLPEDPCVADETSAIDATPSLPDEPCVAIVEVPAAITAPEAMLPEDPCTVDEPAIINVIPSGPRAMPVATLMMEFALQDLPGHAQAGSLDAAGLLPRLQGLVGQWISERSAGPAIHLADIVLMPQGVGAMTAYVSVDVYAMANANTKSPLTRGDVDDMLADLQHFCEAGNGESAFGLRLDLQGIDLVAGKIEAAVLRVAEPESDLEVMPIVRNDTDNQDLGESTGNSDLTMPPANDNNVGNAFEGGFVVAVPESTALELEEILAGDTVESNPPDNTFLMADTAGADIEMPQLIPEANTDDSGSDLEVMFSNSRRTAEEMAMQITSPNGTIAQRLRIDEMEGGTVEYFLASNANTGVRETGVYFIRAGSADRMTLERTFSADGNVIETYVLNNRDVHFRVEYRYPPGGGQIPQPYAGFPGMPALEVPVVVDSTLTTVAKVVTGGVIAAGAVFGFWAAIDHDSLRDATGSGSNSPAAPGRTALEPAPVTVGVQEQVVNVTAPDAPVDPVTVPVDSPVEPVNADLVLTGPVVSAPVVPAWHIEFVMPAAPAHAPLKYGNDEAAHVDWVYPIEFSAPPEAGDAAAIAVRSSDHAAIGAMLAHWMDGIDPTFAACIFGYEIADFDGDGDMDLMLLLTANYDATLSDEAHAALQQEVQAYLTAPAGNTDDALLTVVGSPTGGWSV